MPKVDSPNAVASMRTSQDDLGAGIENPVNSNDSIAKDKEGSDFKSVNSPDGATGSATEGKNNRHLVYLFVNPTSGGNKAAEYVDWEKVGVDGAGDPFIVDDHDCQAELRIYNIRDGKSGDKPGFKSIKAQKSGGYSNAIRVMVAGGDGTVMWAISELAPHGISPDDVAIGVIPFGTGNDYSRVTGWGPDAPKYLIGQKQTVLRQDIRKWIRATTVPFDIWEVAVETQDDGDFMFVHDRKKCVATEGDRAQHNITKTSDGTWRMVKPMCNYFSFGWQERAGLGFEKNRTKSKTMNLIKYMQEGTKKLFKRPPMNNKICNNLCYVDAAPQQHKVKQIAPAPNEDIFAKKSVCTHDITFDRKNKATAHFKKDCADLIFLNIASFAGGADFWKWTSTLAWEGGTEGGEGPPPDLATTKQNFGDHKLDVLSFASAMGASHDTARGKTSKFLVPGSAGKRVAQAAGPFYVDFKETSEAEYKTPEGRVYFQIDGEFFVCRKPGKVRLQLGMSIQVLYNDSVPKPGCC